MATDNKITIFLVDDDIVFLQALEIEFIHHGSFIIHTFSTGELCMDNLYYNPDVIILDYHLDGINKNAMNGLEISSRIKAFNPNILVVMLSSQDNIEVALNCMHLKAFDYVIKSETAFLRLQKIITTILKYNKMEKELNWYMKKM